MQNRIQPILCCVGADVAGEPTQFLMERAAAAAQLDWHVITVEVTSESLVKAWQGMDVMGFQAIRFFPTHQVAAMSLVVQPTADDQFVGSITSAQRVGSQWTIWHNSGPALLELLGSRVSWKDAIVWLHGNGANLRSLLLACMAQPPRHILWSGTDLQLPPAQTSPLATEANSSIEPSLGTSNAEVSSTESSGQASDSRAAKSLLLPTHLAAALSIEIIPSDREAKLAELLSAQLASDDQPTAVVYVGPDDARHLDIIVSSQPTQDCVLALVSAAPGSRRKLNDLWRAGEVCVITPAELVVAEEALDQVRWTGQPANIELLREAYEEYADF